MNRKMKRYLILILGVLSFISCGKFLEEFSQDLAYAESCTDWTRFLSVMDTWNNRYILRKRVFMGVGTILTFM